MTIKDALATLVHDHGDLNRQVLEIGAVISSDEPIVVSKTKLDNLREQLFLHFAREEEGLFPFVADHVPELAARVHAMEVAHDTICGAIARMCHLLAAGTTTSLSSLYDRFAAAYAGHAKMEAELLQNLHDRLDDDERAALAALVRDL